MPPKVNQKTALWQKIRDFMLLDAPAARPMREDEIMRNLVPPTYRRFAPQLFDEVGNPKRIAETNKLFDSQCSPVGMQLVGVRGAGQSWTGMLNYLDPTCFTAKGGLPFQPFPGYPMLSMWCIDEIISVCIEILVEDSIRTWFDVHSEDNEGDVVKQSSGNIPTGIDLNAQELGKFCDKINLKSITEKYVRTVLRFGGALVYFDTGEKRNLSQQMSDTERLQALRVIEPYNVAPIVVNYSRPLREDWLCPETYYIFGENVHHSRFYRGVFIEPPDMLKPMFNFFGKSFTQLLLEGAQNFKEAFTEAIRLLKTFSTLNLKTPLFNAFAAQNDESILTKRVKMMVQKRANSSILITDADTEELQMFNSTVGKGITDLVEQTVNRIATISRIPSSKLTGVLHGGLGAASGSQSESDNYYDYILSFQEKVMRPFVQKVFDMAERKNPKWKKCSFDFNVSNAGKAAEIQQRKVMSMKDSGVFLQTLHADMLISTKEARLFIARHPEWGLTMFGDEPEDVDDRQAAEQELKAGSTDKNKKENSGEKVKKPLAKKPDNVYKNREGYRGRENQSAGMRGMKPSASAATTAVAGKSASVQLSSASGNYGKK